MRVDLLSNLPPLRPLSGTTAAGSHTFAAAATAAGPPGHGWRGPVTRRPVAPERTSGPSRPNRGRRGQGLARASAVPQLSTAAASAPSFPAQPEPPAHTKPEGLDHAPEAGTVAVAASGAAASTALATGAGAGGPATGAGTGAGTGSAPATGGNSSDNFTGRYMRRGRIRPRRVGRVAWLGQENNQPVLEGGGGRKASCRIAWKTRASRGRKTEGNRRYTSTGKPSDPGEVPDLARRRAL